MSSAPAPALTEIGLSRTEPAPSVFTTPAPAPAVFTILVVEDYSDTRELLSGLFRYQGYKVIEAADGLEGLLKAMTDCPDLIILDLALPEMDGIELARRIHGEAKLRLIPIFVVSAYLTDEVRTDAHAAGCIEVIAKPFDAVALLKKAARVLNPAR